MPNQTPNRIYSEKGRRISESVRYNRKNQARGIPPVLPLRTIAFPPPTRHRPQAPSEDRDKVLNTIPRILGDTLRDPRDTSNLLFLQLEESIEH